jgi:hypothetical protein
MHRLRWWLTARGRAKLANCLEELQPMTERQAKPLKVCLGQLGQDFGVEGVVAKCRPILLQAEVP